MHGGTTTSISPHSSECMKAGNGSNLENTAHSDKRGKCSESASSIPKKSDSFSNGAVAFFDIEVRTGCIVRVPIYKVKSKIPTKNDNIDSLCIQLCEKYGIVQYKDALLYLIQEHLYKNKITLVD